jgi:allantoinase
MAAADRVVRSRRVVLPDGARPATIHIREGRIERIGTDLAGTDFGDFVIMPGLVDTHVHINEPGRTDWEGFTTATRAAAAGGITTLVEMPLNAIPPVTSVDALAAKINAAREQCWVDVGFWGGVVPGNMAEIAPLLEAGCRGFKCFLTPSGVPEFAHVAEADLREAMPELARRGAVLLAHAELPAELRAASGDPRSHRTWLGSRPRGAEDGAIELLIRLSAEYGCRVHIVHLSSGDSIARIERARAAGVQITVETCPHYLVFSGEDIAAGATEFKCAPPIREAANRDALWEGLRRGAIDAVVTDHSPSPAEMKMRERGDFLAAWGGIASLQLSLAATWTEASRRGFGIEDLARWMSAAPARLAGLEHRKGAIAPGRDADLVIWDPDAEFTVDPARLHHRHKLTPYAGRRLRGAVRETWLSGEPVAIDGPPRGRVLLREAGLARLNTAPPAAAMAELLRCCGSTEWANRMASARPYASVAALEQAAESAWRECARAGWLEAFAAHPKIGERGGGAWPRQEQSGAAGADQAVLEKLNELNRRYEEKFGYIYIVCATGKSAAEMLAILQRRLENDAATEILEAAAQQLQITRLRLRRLLSE